MEENFGAKVPFMRLRGRKAWHKSCQVSFCLTRDMSSLLEPKIVRIIHCHCEALHMYYSIDFFKTEEQLTNHSIFADKKREHPFRNGNLGIQRTIFCELRKLYHIELQ